MANDGSTHDSLEILLVFSEMPVLQGISKLIEDHFNRSVNISVFHNALEAIEHLETSKKNYSLIVFEYKSTSHTIVRAIVEVGGTAAFLLCGSNSEVLNSFRDTEVPIIFVPHESLFEDLPKAINRLEVTGKIPLFQASESDYISIRPDYLPDMGVLEATVYIQMIDGHFVPVFNQGESVERSQVERYLESKKLTHFYFKRSDCKGLLEKRAERVKDAAENKNIAPKEAEKEIEVAQAIVRDVVASIGFTPEAQKVAVESVSATIKLMGSKPKLSTILVDLKSKEGNYLTNHSLQLGKVSCAMAYKVGWKSGPTYLKLTLAAFLHDITLKDEKLAVVLSLEKATTSGKFTPEELKEIRFHATKAAEHARSISDVPSDVEQIVAQHHERPDGSGFPRGISYKIFSPLSALFIIAQDLIEYTRIFANKEINLETFYEAREAYYKDGVFRKIFYALKTDTELT